MSVEILGRDSTGKPREVLTTPLGELVTVTNLSTAGAALPIVTAGQLPAAGAYLGSGITIVPRPPGASRALFFVNYTSGGAGGAGTVRVCGGFAEQEGSVFPILAGPVGSVIGAVLAPGGYLFSLDLTPGLVTVSIDARESGNTGSPGIVDASVIFS